MSFNWPTILFLFFLAFPGVYIVIPRLIHLLLPHNSKELKSRFTRIMTVQTLIMVLLMSAAGSVLSLATGLGDPVLTALLQGQSVFASIEILPVLIATIFGLILFLFLYYGIASKVLDPKTLTVMKTLRSTFGIDGCLLYGSVVEEILARWGLINVITFFAFLYTGDKQPVVIWTAIIISGLMVAIGHLPAFIAAGCLTSRRFIYIMLVLHLTQALIFGWIFWHYGLLLAIFSHMLFYLGWYFYDRA
ncbi:CPBP family intramembrane glutamate endopeptidase [Legionella sp. D16C41]|uniref:CPBP family intramembrane glutamate endopeptidase n=1 Tax=Legionella sp. D16C41 TaxID=3402688 RepID=UPI003AF9C6F3